MLHRCPQCPYSSTSKSNVKRHQFGVHGTKDDKLRCVDSSCSFQTTQDSILIQHHKQKHQAKSALACDTCQYVCATLKGLTKHLLLHTKPKTMFICHLCPMFKTLFKKNLKRHITNKHPSPTLSIIESSLHDKVNQTVESSSTYTKPVFDQPIVVSSDSLFNLISSTNQMVVYENMPPPLDLSVRVAMDTPVYETYDSYPLPVDLSFRAPIENYQNIETFETSTSTNSVSFSTHSANNTYSMASNTNNRILDSLSTPVYTDDNM
jgi:hypothetical protein